MSKIGIVASTERSARRYIESIEKRGGSVFLIIPQEPQLNLLDIMESIGGLMLTGGEDIDPNEGIRKEGVYIDLEYDKPTPPAL